MRWILRSKIHRATVTEANVDYVGSITIDSNLVEAAGFWDGEKVLLASVTTGQRLETYIVFGEPGTGEICVNGAAAQLIKKGEVIIIMGFELADQPRVATIVHVDKDNKIINKGEQNGR